MKRKASAVWEGRLKDGNGKITTHSGVLWDTSYSFGTRFENQGGTNPEELVAAAHAACFSMELSAQLEKLGLKPERVSTSCTLTLEKEAGTWAVTNSQLETLAVVPGSNQQQFEKVAHEAKVGCPISRLLKVPITLNAKLEINHEMKKAG